MEEDEFAQLLASGKDIESVIKDVRGSESFKHADDAFDFEDEDELADDDLPEEEEAPGSPMGDDWVAELGFGAELDQEDDAPPIDQKALDRELLAMYYPSFQPNTALKMNTLFGPRPSQLQLPQPRATRPCLPSRLRLDTETDQRATFKSTVARPPRHYGVVTIEESSSGGSKIDEILQVAEVAEKKRDLTWAAADWEAVLDPETPPSAQEPPATKIRIHEDDIYGSDFEDQLLEGTLQLAKPRAQINMNDPHLLFVEDRGMATNRWDQVQNRYNISNDKAYDLLKENYQNKVRATIGNLNIDHSLIASRLQSPFYKVNLSKTQMRSWHRPKFQTKPGQVLTFLPLKSRKKKDKGKPITQLLAKSGDMTLGDNAPVFLIEYCEEFPLVLSNVGMGSKLINYYRKKTPEDTARPKLPLGETHVLDVQDRSAFWNFGFVEPGNVVPTLYNQMIRAPVFRHDPRKTDFLLVRSTNKARGQRFFLRPIPYMFVTGQTLPVTQIPGPHSRKVTTASKNRLKMIVYRVLNKDNRHRLQVRDISAHFPDQNDMQNRQRLKEFMEYQRSGSDQGFWKIKQGDNLPNEEAIRTMINPEDISLLEAMQVGQQHLEDSGYGKTVDDDRDDDGKSLEEQLAPWNVSRNFINAIQGKAMLQLHGDGDPTSRGEGFSLLRTSMKGGFKAANEEKVDKSKLGGHSYNVAEQQKAYEREIKRIWYAQGESLRITDPRKLPAEKQPEPTTPAAAEEDEGGSQNVLRITRMVKDANDVVVRKTEIVTDPNVIRAYVKRRRDLEDAQMAPDDIAVTNDEERNKRNKKILLDELARLRRNQDRRLARKATKGDTKSGQKIKSTTRKCATCGAIGHIKTNKSCPMYNDIYLGGQGNNNAETPAPVPNLP